MLKQKKNVILMILLITVICLAMAFVDAVISPSYFIKSEIKLILFILLPILFLWRTKQLGLGKEILRIDKQKLRMPILLGVGVYFFIIGTYIIIGPFFDFSQVTVALANNYGVHKENFIGVALYISFVNSLLEELFFRGFAFLILKKRTSKSFAYVFSSLAFALYHIAIMTGWFGLPLFLLLIVSLFLAGLLFNWLNEKCNNIYTSWLVHMCANFATNTIGFILFGIL